MPKVVVILVDAGQSMSTPLSAGQGQGTILDAVKVIVQEFFKTLEPQDYVNIIMFGSTKVTPLSPSMVIARTPVSKFWFPSFGNGFNTLKHLQKDGISLLAI